MRGERLGGANVLVNNAAVLMDGVLVTEEDGGWVRRLPTALWRRVREIGLSPRDAVLITTSCSFDLTRRNLFGPLSAGAQVHLAAEPFHPAASSRRSAAAG